jgi:pyruvate formate lyase activating enzyme
VEAESEKGLVFNIQRFSVNDGPGIRTTVFLKGCPLRCLWCSNPESQEGYPEIMVISRDCIRCHECVEICPTGAVCSGEEGVWIDRDTCDLCMKCVHNCPSGALRIVGEHMDIHGIVKEVKKDGLFYRNSGGGVTVSGGEPLAQWEFVRNLLAEMKREGLHTVLDTSGYAPWGVVAEVIAYADLVLYDVKCIDPVKHEAMVGQHNKLILTNAEKVASRVATWLRIPVIPGLNDAEADIEDIARFASEIPFEKVSILGYHRFGEHKYEGLGRKCPSSGVSQPEESYLKTLRDTFAQSGLNATIGH